MAGRSRIILFGDSITQESFSAGGWGMRLAEEFTRKVLHSFAQHRSLIMQADVLNRGYSGFSSRTALPLLPHVFPANANENLLATVFFGANDAAMPGGELPQHVPVGEYFRNLSQIIQHIKKSTKVRDSSVFFISAYLLMI
jgi:lysophospholipase L1-like esterase